MPEGDTAFLAAHRLHQTLPGKTLSRTDFRVPALATKDRSGARVERVYAAGKLLFIVLTAQSGRTLAIHSHLMMDGALSPVEGSPIAHLGPDLLGPAWDAKLAAQNLAATPDRAIGLALFDQCVLAGVDNVYRSELCFLAGVHPAASAGDVVTASMADRAHALLIANALEPVRSTTGSRRRGQELWVYGRDRRPCRRCGTPIRRGTLGARNGPAGERVIYFCPACQRAGPQTG